LSGGHDVLVRTSNNYVYVEPHQLGSKIRQSLHFAVRITLHELNVAALDIPDLPVAALADRRVRGEFKSWREKFGNTPRKADYAWTTFARIMSFAKDRGIIATNPCERGGRLYVADRRDKIWSEQDIAAVLAVASSEIQLALILALWSGQRQGDLLRLPWSAYETPIHSTSPIQGRPARRDACRRSP